MVQKKHAYEWNRCQPTCLTGGDPASYRLRGGRSIMESVLYREVVRMK